MYPLVKDKARCLGCGRTSKEGFGQIKHDPGCPFRGGKK